MQLESPKGSISRGINPAIDAEKCIFELQQQQPTGKGDFGPNPHPSGRCLAVSDGQNDGSLGMSKTSLELDKDCMEHATTLNEKITISGIQPETTKKSVKSTTNSTNAMCFGLSNNRYINSAYEKPSNSKEKLKYTAVIMVEIEDCHGNLVPIKALLDTGTDESLV